MALQLLKRNYTMQGYEAPKILKLPQGETRWAPRRLPVDVGDVIMNLRMNDAKNKYIGEHVSKYSQGLNPYGEWNYPYKVNKNNIRPPIIDPKYYEPLSRMPVKFDAVTVGPIVKDLYGKRVKISKVAPKTIIDKVCPDVAPRVSMRGENRTDASYHEGSIDLHLKQPKPSIPYHPSMPVHQNTGVPQIELDGKLITRPQMGIHFPFHVSDQSRDINNMRTPMHVAVKPGYKDPYTFVQPTPEDIQGINEELTNVAAGSGYTPLYSHEPEINTNIQLEPGVQTAADTNVVAPVPTVSNLTRDGYDLTPKVRTSAWYNPSYYLTENNGYNIGSIDENCIDNKPQVAAKAPHNYRMIDHGGHDVPITTRNVLHSARQTNVSSRLLQDGELGDVHLPNIIHAGEYDPRANVPTIQNHQDYNRTRDTNTNEYFFVENHSNYGDAVPRNFQKTQSGIRNRLELQSPRDNRTHMEPMERVVPVGTGRFVHSTM